MRKLSIYLPTYNRPKMLEEQICRLLPQLDDTELTVLDNASDYDIQALIPPNVRYGRNAINIGSIGNVIRCFEMCQSEWLWICSDDDPILNDSVNRIYQLIEQFPDVCFISSSSTLVKHYENRKVYNIPDLIDLFPTFDRILWLTGGIYNTRFLKKHLQIPQYLHCAAPQTVLMFMGLMNRVPVGVTPLVISNHNIPEDPKERWNLYEVLTYLSDFVDLPLDSASRIKIAHSLENCLINFDLHFLQICKTISAGIQGSDELVQLFSSRWAKLFFTIGDQNKCIELINRMNILRDTFKCTKILNDISPDIVNSIPLIKPNARLYRL
jgi:glycosyltransferase involved in cell wall biosynthesis